jgi:hypothetical protein
MCLGGWDGELTKLVSFSPQSIYVRINKISHICEMHAWNRTEAKVLPALATAAVAAIATARSATSIAGAGTLPLAMAAFCF